MEYTIYSITGPNGKTYVGMTKYSLKKRIREHLSFANTGKKYPLHEDIRKFGWDSFKVKTLAICNSRSAAIEFEKFYIQKKESFKNGYNLTVGGIGTKGFKHTDAQRLATSKRHKLWAKKVGFKYYSEQAKKVWKNPKFRKKFIESAKKRSTPEIMRARQASSVKARIARKPEFKVRIKNQNSTLKFRSVAECARDLNISINSVIRYLNGVRKSKDFVFNYTGRP